MPPPAKVWTVDEVSDHLRLTRRVVMKLARDHQCCSIVGRTFLFSDQDVDALWKATRVQQPTRIQSQRVRVRMPGAKSDLFKRLERQRKRP